MCKCEIFHEGACWSFDVYDVHICFGDPELRPSFGIPGLQGPHTEKEKLEKERNELRDLVMPMLPSSYLILNIS